MINNQKIRAFESRISSRRVRNCCFVNSSLDIENSSHAKTMRQATLPLDKNQLYPRTIRLPHVLLRRLSVCLTSPENTDELASICRQHSKLRLDLGRKAAECA